MQCYMLIEGGDLTKCKWHPVEKAKIGSLDAERVADANSAAGTYETGFESVADSSRLLRIFAATLVPVSRVIVAALHPLAKQTYIY